MKKQNVKYEHHDSTKELLIQTAKHLFARRGYDGVTVRDIADTAKVNFSLIRYHFGDKKGIYCACLERYGNARLNSAQRILEPIKSTEEFKIRLKLIMHEIVDSLMLDPDLSKMMIREMESDEPIAADIIRNTLVKMAQSFVMFFTSAQKNGIIKKDIDPLFLTQIIQMTLSHLILTDSARSKFFGVSLKNSTTKNTLVDNLYGVLISGILIT